jgi:DNA-binding NarL/FixJ family response regulator
LVAPIRVAIVNDFQIIVEGVRALLRPYAPGILAVETEVLETPKRRVDVTLFDTFGAQDRDILARVRELSGDPTNGAIVIFSFSDQPELIEALTRAGARGYVSKAAPGDAIAGAIRDAASGKQVRIRRRASGLDAGSVLRWPGRRNGLTGRESELLALLPSGLSNRELAEKLYVSENTIKTQLRHLYAKLGVRNRVQAATTARDLLDVGDI